MKNFFLGVIATLIVIAISSKVFKHEDSWERELNKVENRKIGVVYIVHNPDLDGINYSQTGFGEYGQSTVIVYRHGADARDALLRAQGSDKKFIDFVKP